MATKLMGPEQPTISAGPHPSGPYRDWNVGSRERGSGENLSGRAAVSLSPAKTSLGGELQGCLAKPVGFAQLPAWPQLSRSSRCRGGACPR